MADPVTYRINVDHWLDGDIEVTVHGIGESKADREAVAAALRQAADQIVNGDRRIVYS